MKVTANVLIAIASLAFLVLPMEAATIHVPDDQPTIQAGIDAASAGDTVLVACDTYYEHDINMRSGVCLTSQTGEAGCVTVDAQQQGRVFRCDGVDSLASIVGFTISGGLATGSEFGRYGGGMFCESSSPRLHRCEFSGNEATGLSSRGGGMHCLNSSPRLDDCVFAGNRATDAGSMGGGMCCEALSSPTLTACTFSGNCATYGGAMTCMGFCSPNLTACIFSGNQADGHGGAMDCQLESQPTLTMCAFSGNQTTGPGGAIHCYSSSPALTSCTMSGNEANHGGGISCYSSSSPLLMDCIVAFTTHGEAVYCSDEQNSPVLMCCDLFGNEGGDWVDCVAEQHGVDGNFSEDPLFCDVANDDFTLAANSPCLPGGNGCGVLIGAYGEGCPEVSVEPSSWGSIKAMFR